MQVATRSYKGFYVVARGGPVVAPVGLVATPVSPVFAPAGPVSAWFSTIILCTGLGMVLSAWKCHGLVGDGFALLIREPRR